MFSMDCKISNFWRSYVDISYNFSLVGKCLHFDAHNTHKHIYTEIVENYSTKFAIYNVPVPGGGEGAEEVKKRNFPFNLFHIAIQIY
jgi:hypothetical protein